MSDIVQKLWGFCHTLRHDGIDYGDYIEQLTCLLFLKMADERAAAVPKSFDGLSLNDKSGTALTDHYADMGANEQLNIKDGDQKDGISVQVRDWKHLLDGL